MNDLTKNIQTNTLETDVVVMQQIHTWNVV